VCEGLIGTLSHGGWQGLSAPCRGKTAHTESVQGGAEKPASLPRHYTFLAVGTIVEYFLLFTHATFWRSDSKYH
jgi:hypothetical protein